MKSLCNKLLKECFFMKNMCNKIVTLTLVTVFASSLQASEYVREFARVGGGRLSGLQGGERGGLRGSVSQAGPVIIPEPVKRNLLDDRSKQLEKVFEASRSWTLESLFFAVIPKEELMTLQLLVYDLLQEAIKQNENIKNQRGVNADLIKQFSDVWAELGKAIGRKATIDASEPGKRILQSGQNKLEKASVKSALEKSRGTSRGLLLALIPQDELLTLHGQVNKLLQETKDQKGVDPIAQRIRIVKLEAFVNELVKAAHELR